MSTSRFEFITFQHANDFKSPSKRRTARSHVVKRALELRASGLRGITTPTPIVSPGHIASLSPGALDPFESLPVDQRRLQALLLHPKAQEAVEPVFSISDPYAFYHLHGAYANAFADPAFSSALMCTLLLAKHDYVLQSDVLRYQGQAIAQVNRQLDSASSYECTIGAILLLIGVEWRTASINEAKIHLKGVEDLFQICESTGRNLPPGVRRGIFWQDVNTAIVSGTDRVIRRPPFPQYIWEDALFSTHWARLPIGFEYLRNTLGSGTVQLLQDASVLQKYAEGLACSKPDLPAIYLMDNMQACIEGRTLERMQEAESSQIKTIVLLSTYVFTYSLFTQIWNGSSIPNHISSRLLFECQSSLQSLSGDIGEPVVLWAIIVAGSLCTTSDTRTGFRRLLRAYFADTISNHSVAVAWLEVSGILDQFLWSQSIFGGRALAFLAACVGPKHDLDTIDRVL